MSVKRNCQVSAATLNSGFICPRRSAEADKNEPNSIRALCERNTNVVITVFVKYIALAERILTGGIALIVGGYLRSLMNR